MMEYGVQYAMTGGEDQKLKWYADNLATPVQVLLVFQYTDILILM